MRIGIDARLYNQTGVGRYIRNIIYHLSRTDKKNEYIIYLRKEDFGNFKIPNKRWRKILADIPWHTISEQWQLPKLLVSHKLDVAHFTYFNVPIFYPGKYLLTIHDLIVDHFDTGRASTLPGPLHKFKRLGYKIAMSVGIARAAAVTAISETTKREVIKHYNILPAKVTVTFDALDSRFAQKIAKVKPVSYYDFPYILYVGNCYPHKNLERLVKAFKEVLRQKPRLKLVFSGDDDYFYPRLKKFAQNQGILRKVVFFGNANDSQLIRLYKNAKCLVFPSLMEGFGLPNLEALSCSCLPVVSQIPAFAEIWGDRLDFFDPEDTFDMAEKIINVLSLSSLQYKKKVDKARKRIEDFSWEKTAKKTLKLYEKINRS